MNEEELENLIKQTEKDRQFTATCQNRIISQMVDVARKETDRLEHHLSEMPLSVIVYQWIIIRLKSRPWRLLFPASLALSILLQGILSRYNLFQFLTRP